MIDGGMIVIVQALISQVSLIPCPFTKNEGLVYTVPAQKLLRSVYFLVILSVLAWFYLASHRLCEVNGAI